MDSEKIEFRKKKAVRSVELVLGVALTVWGLTCEFRFSMAVFALGLILLMDVFSNQWWIKLILLLAGIAALFFYF